jgi:hypothetical protein
MKTTLITSLALRAQAPTAVRGLAEGRGEEVQAAIEAEGAGETAEAGTEEAEWGSRLEDTPQVEIFHAKCARLNLIQNLHSTLT